MKTKRIVLGVLIIIIASVIFFFSSQNGENSSKVSNTVTVKVIDTYTSIKKENISLEKKNQLIENMSFYIRKLAHFSMYFLLGIFIYLFVETYNIKHSLIFSLLCTNVYAISDEFHQLFSFGRSAEIRDVLLDTLEALCGILFIKGIEYIIFKLKKIKTQ